jgi:hypothetical protein
VWLVAPQSEVWSATYFVRADGTAPAMSYATSCSSAESAMSLSTHNNQSLAPGDRIVLCNEGGVFRAELRAARSGSAGSPITYDGRGTAVVAASDLITDWVAAAGNIYVAHVPTQPQQVFVDGRFGDRKTGTGSLVDEYDWYWSSSSLYLYAPGDPDTRYSSPGVEAGARSRCIRVAGDHITIDGLTAKHSNQHNIMAYNSTGITFENLTSEWAWELGIVISGNTPQSDNAIQDCVARFNGAGGVSSAYSRTGRMANHTYRRNTCYENGRHQFATPLWSTAHQFTFGIKIWGNHLASTGVVIAENEVFDNGPAGTTIDSSQKGNGIWVDEVNGSSEAPIVIRHNLCYNNVGSGVFLENTSLNDVHANVLYRNATGSAVLTPYAAGGVKLLARQGYDTSNNNILNNTIVGGWIGLQVTSYDQVAGLEVSHNTFRNNIVVAAEGRILRATGGGDNRTWGTGNVYDNNCFGAESPDFIHWGLLDFDTYAAWEAASGGPSSSIKDDPQLAGDSWELLFPTAGSPCCSSGENLGADFDDVLLESSRWTDSVVTIDQGLNGDGWDVGAYSCTRGLTRPSGTRRVP